MASKKTAKKSTAKKSTTKKSASARKQGTGAGGFGMVPANQVRDLTKVVDKDPTDPRKPPPKVPDSGTGAGGFGTSNGTSRKEGGKSR